MPNSTSVPILVSRYGEASYVAQVLLVSDYETCGDSQRVALERLERFLVKRAKRGLFWAYANIVDASLQEYTVTARTAERDKNKVVNFGPKIKVKVRCVFAKGDQGETWCVLPDWNVTFLCDQEKNPKAQVVELVRQHFADLSTNQLLTRLPPTTLDLRLVRLKIGQRNVHHELDCSPLDVVADPISTRNRKQSGQSAWFRDVEVQRLVTHFYETSSTLLLGEPGCGKTTIVQAAAQRLQDDERVKRLMDSSDGAAPPLVWRTTGSNLIAAMQYLGQWEERLEAVISKLAEFNAILFVDSIVELIRLGGRTPEDSIAAFMLPYLRRNELRLVSEASSESLEACRRLLPGFAEMFRVQSIAKLSAQATQDIASRILKETKRNHRIEAQDACAETVVGLYQRYLPYQSPPRGPVSILNRLIGQARKSKSNTITLDQLFERFTGETGLPSRMVRDSERIDPVELKQHFDREVIGQPQATDVAVNTVIKLKAGMVDPQRPVATMLFCGPTGVGKTQLARSIADYVLAGRNDGGRLVRLDMSEYQSWGAVDRLLMTPQGEPATWIQRLRTWPLGVLLLDEFEKAAPEVFDCLLSAFDEGRITDRFGRTTTLCGTIIVLTSNVGASHSTSVGFVSDHSRRYRQALEQTFRPEFLNRLDSITTFEPLSRETVKQIVEKELIAIDQRPAMKERGLRLRWPSELVERLAEVGFDPALGARPLQRQVEREVISPLARWLLKYPDHVGEIDWADVTAPEIF